MQIVINIPEKLACEGFERSFTEEEKNILIKAIGNGTPFPKGHGKIGDLDKLIRAMKERNDDNGGEPLNAADRGYNLAFQHMIKESKECVIIEADKAEGSEEE